MDPMKILVIAVIVMAIIFLIGVYLGYRLCMKQFKYHKVSVMEPVLIPEEYVMQELKSKLEVHMIVEGMIETKRDSSTLAKTVRFYTKEEDNG